MSSDTQPGRLPFAVSHYICPPEWPLSRFLDTVTELGFSGVGLTERALMEVPARSIRSELIGRGLAVSSVNSAGFFTKDGEDARWQDQRNHDLLQWSSELGCAALNVIVGGTGGLAPAKARAKVMDAMDPFVAEADRLGVPLMLEPLHPMRMRDKSCINTLAHYERIQQRFPSLRLTVDLFHAWWDPDLDRSYRDFGEKIGVLQICDIVDEGGLTRRVPLDEGILDWRTSVMEVQEFLPHVPIELELFADQLTGRATGTLLSDASRKLTALNVHTSA